MTRLDHVVEEYLAVRRGLGYKLKREGMLLPDFARFLEQQGSPFITSTLAVQWATQPAGVSRKWGAARLRMVRQLARYASALDPCTEVPASDLLPYREVRRTPYIYAEGEITRLLAATGTLRSPVMRSTYATLIGLLACTGLRVGEALALDRTDIDWCEKTLLIRRAKFGKSRLVPLHNTAIDRLEAYATIRDGSIRRPRTSNFFLEHDGMRLDYSNAAMTFLRLVHRAGLAHARPRRPRIHDMRHSFAVKTLLRWYREGVDVEAWLPRLSTYLGHVSPSSTYWYLTATPELLAIAAARAERSLKVRP